MSSYSHGSRPVTARPDLGKSFSTGNRCHAGQEDCFLNLFVCWRTAMAHPEPTMVIFKLSPEIAMLSATFRYTPPLPLVPPFLLAQNPFLRTWRHQMKLSCRIYPATFVNVKQQFCLSHIYSSLFCNWDSNIYTKSTMISLCIAYYR